jgi:SAM-dependent methyltransferase
MGYEGRNNIIITLLNLNTQKTYSDNIHSIEGNACDLSRFKNKSYDIVFSNSVIEHVGNFQMQNKIAKEVMRVGKAIYIQTPNYWFPFEPHTLTIGYQFLPLKIRIFLIQNFDQGWTGKFKDKEKAKEAANNVHLLSKSDLKELFPNSIIKKKYFMFLVKSFILIQTSGIDE